MRDYRDPGSPLTVMAPFAGLDTRHQPRELGPRWASRAHNVLLDKGTIQPRPPFEADSRFAFFPAGKVFAGVDWYPPALSQHLRSLDSILHVGDELFSVMGGSFGPVAQRQGSFVFAAGFLYYMDGVQVFRFDGTNWVIAGIPPPIVTGPAVSSTFLLGPPPPANQIIWRIEPGLASGVLPSAALAWDTTYQFRFTWYDANTGVESNSDFTLETSTGPAPANPGAQLPFLIYRSGSAPPQRGVTRVRAYVRNVTAGESFFRLWTQSGVNQPPPFDFTAPLLGSVDTGPFVPFLNGIPEHASVGWFYKNRMFYNDLRFPTRLRYSALDRPEHLADDDFETLDDDGGQITGMAEHAGQLAVIKERSLWILSGTVFGPTNATVNAGVPRSSIVKTHEVYRTKVVTGCANVSGGNGAVRFSKGIGYNSHDGFYVFDGVSETRVSPLIDPTWKEFVGDKTFGHFQAVSYGHDTRRAILFMVNLSVDTERVPILAYHYKANDGAGAWTTLGPDNPADNPTCIIDLIGVQDVSAPPLPSGLGSEVRAAGLVIATGSFQILGWNDVRTDLPLPPFEYRTGELVIKEGLDAHFYWAKWFISAVPGGVQRAIEFGFQLFPENVDIYKEFGISADTRIKHKIDGQGQTIMLLARKPTGGDPRWHPDMSILGFGLDAEPVGQ